MLTECLRSTWCPTGPCPVSVGSAEPGMVEYGGWRAGDHPAAVCGPVTQCVICACFRCCFVWASVFVLVSEWEELSQGGKNRTLFTCDTAVGSEGRSAPPGATLEGESVDLSPGAPWSTGGAQVFAGMQPLGRRCFRLFSHRLHWFPSEETLLVSCIHFRTWLWLSFHSF